MSAAARTAIATKHREVVRLARELFPQYIQLPPEISFKLRGRSVAGKARGHTKVFYNVDYYLADPDDYLNDIIPHEIAHIVCAATGLGRGHNYGWQRVARAIGARPERCISRELSDKAKVLVPKARQTSEYLYKTSTGHEVWVGPVHHSRMQRQGVPHDHPEVRKHYSLRTRGKGAIYRDFYLGRSRLKA